LIQEKTKETKEKLDPVRVERLVTQRNLEIDQLLLLVVEAVNV
jgi:hypothetical protein